MGLGTAPPPIGARLSSGRSGAPEDIAFCTVCLCREWSQTPVFARGYLAQRGRLRPLDARWPALDADDSMAPLPGV